MNVRLDKFLSSQTDLTRTDIKKLLWKRKISVNGKILRDGSIKIDPETSEIIADGRKILYRDKVYIILNKPEGFVCATEDKHEKTVMDLLGDDIKRKDIFPAGRLDKDTEGFLIVTNDGAFSHRLMSPRHHVDKTYYFEAEGLLAEDAKKQVLLGIDIGDEKPTLPAQLTVLKADQGKQTICGTIILQEGRYHQVKRMLLKLGVKVTYLKRTAIGSVLLDPSLAKGTYRALTKEEMKQLTGEDNNE